MKILKTLMVGVLVTSALTLTSGIGNAQENASFTACQQTSQSGSSGCSVHGAGCNIYSYTAGTCNGGFSFSNCAQTEQAEHATGFTGWCNTINGSLSCVATSTPWSSVITVESC